MRSRAPLICSAWWCLIGSTLLAAEPQLRRVEPDDKTGTCTAVVVGERHLAHTAQLFPLDKDGKLLGKDRVQTQAEAVLDNLAAALKEVRSGADDLVKLNVYVTRTEAVGAVAKVFAKRFGGEAKPAVSFVVTKLPHPDALVAMDAVAVSSLDPGAAGVKRVRGPDGLQVSVLAAGPRVYVSGQAEKGNDLADGARRTLEGLKATLTHLNLKETDVVQVKAFLKPMADADQVRKEVARVFGDPPPPLVMVEWMDGFPTEIELIASAKGQEAKAPVEYIPPPKMKPSPVYSWAARVDGRQTIYISGLYAAEAGDAASQVEQLFAELKRVLDKTGSDLKHLAKATYYTSDEPSKNKLAELRPRYYDPQRPPAASRLTVAGVGREARTLTLDMIAVPSK
jgi:enamine deaminase RidA (YjgF/YER057c/UK114 family)